MIPTADAWGPFRPDIDHGERVARLRCLRAIVHLSTGPRGQTLTDLPLRAERDAELLQPALAVLSGLDALDTYTVPSYALPLAVHYQWCSAVAFTDDEMEAFERELELQL